MHLLVLSPLPFIHYPKSSCFSDEVSQHPSLQCFGWSDPLGPAWLCYSCWEMDTAQGLCIYYPGNIWCLLAYSKIHPSLLRPNWRVACIRAHCLPAGHKSEYTHSVYFLIKIIRQGLQVYSAFLLEKHCFLLFQQRCFNPQQMETQRT